MPPKKKSRAGAAVRTSRRTMRNTDASAARIPDVYQEMLAEVAAEPAAHSTPPRKRQRLSYDASRARAEAVSLDPPGEVEPTVDDHNANTHPQTIVNDFPSSDDEDEFEDVDLEVTDAEVEDKAEQKVLTFELSEPITTPKRSISRPPISLAERKMRLEWHKAHFFLLLLSVWCRNRWCESTQVQAVLKKLVPRKVIKLLHEDDSKPTLQRSHSFNKAIEEICHLWSITWYEVGVGMRRANWRNKIDLNKESEIHEELDFDDFKTAARTHRGSRDLGAQLFCALLRSVAVETRLVCSLQVLPFSAASRGLTPEKSKQSYTMAGPQEFGSSTSGGMRRRQKESLFPVFWVEVLSPVTQAWTPIDPIVRRSINKPKTGFEPPASDPLNAMAYVIAFEDDGSARDVTLRYAQWFNAKTRRLRVESTKGGDEWLRSTLAKFIKPFPEARDEIEDADLLRRSEAEGMPKNIQDFKGHPVYVLERHLRMNEVIYPKREVGMTAIGAGQKGQKLQSVYRRQDVHLCRTSDAWYRRGRDIKQGEVPLKRVLRRIRRTPGPNDDDQETEDDAALYAEFQTELYEPPPVVNGRIPRNSFGNLDVYVRSMIPAGAIHVQHPLAAKAAKLLGIDYADAVTGFEFKGRQGTAIVDGIVVAQAARFGLDAVIIGMQNQLIEEAHHERSILLTSLWKRWLTALRIRERVQRDYGGGSDDNEDEGDETYHDSDEELAGGFVPEAPEASEIPPPQTSSTGGKNVVSRLLYQGLPPVPAHHQIRVSESPHELPEVKVHPSSLTASRPMTLAGTCAAAALSRGSTVEDEGGGFLVEDENIDTRHDRGGNDALGGGGFVADHESIPEQTVDRGLPARGNETSPATSSNGSPNSYNKRSQPPLPNISSQPNTSSKDVLTVFDPGATCQSSFAPLSDESETTLIPQSAESASALMSTGNKAGTHREDDLASTPSLLSHDPEEDDAEPEWLMESLGD